MTLITTLRRSAALALVLMLASPAHADDMSATGAEPGLAASTAPAPTASPSLQQSCFLLTELGKNERRRRPAEACTIMVSPGATFYIAEAIAALDSGLVKTPDDDLSQPRKHKDDAPPAVTLGTALRSANQAVFQDIARRMGNKRLQGYLNNFGSENTGYGNADISSGIASFWSGGSLLISPEQQQSFLAQLWQKQLAVSGSAAGAVRSLLMQNGGTVTSAMGQAHPFNAPWPGDAGVDSIAASTTDITGAGVRWLVGHIKRGPREFVFTSCVTGAAALPDDAAIQLAQTALREEGVLP